MSSYAIVSCFHDAGLPKGVLNLIAYNPSDAAAVTKHLISLPSIKKVTFTGSPIVGKIIAKLAGENLKPIVLELEGRVPAIVLDDADLELAAMDCAIGSFKHSGQIYMSTTRLIVHEKISSEFEIAFKKALRQFEPKGYVADSLINKAAVEKNKKLLQDAISNGATIVYGDPMNWQDARMRPVIVKGLTKKMGLYHTESFGTTVSLITVKSDEEALELANDVEYGLPTTIYTKDLERGLWFARDIESGTVYINGTTVHNETVLPYSGE
jgi:acyl-CoA reductase-like NAD-dependent aldehyde dehydrogenase